MSHTPGPWHYGMAHWGRYQISDGSRNIGELSSYAGLGGRETELNAEQEANAKLIAAAPDLLAACEEFVAKVERGEAKSVRSYQQMKLAIAKAKGAA